MHCDTFKEIENSLNSRCFYSDILGAATLPLLSLHREVRGCAAIAPFNDGYTLIREKGEQYAGSLVKEGFPNTFLNIYQKLLFGKYTEHSGVKGINSTSIPVFIAHGNRDSVISFGGQSIISHMSELRQENVTYYVGTGCQSGHNTILHSPQAVAYQEQVKADLAQLKKQKDGNLSEAELEAFCSQVDHALYSQVNEELMHQIVVMFNKARK